MNPTIVHSLSRTLKTIALCASAPLAGVIIWLNFSSTATGQDAPPESLQDEVKPLVQDTPAFDKYHALTSKSPFDFPIAPPPPPAEIDPFADWALAGMSKIGSNTMFTILNTKNPQERKYIWSDQRHTHGQKGGIEYVQVKGNRTRDAELTIQKDNRRSTIKWSEKVLAQAGGAPGPGGGPRPMPANGAPNPNPGGVPQANNNANNPLLQRLIQERAAAQQATAAADAQKRAEAYRATQAANPGNVPNLADPNAAPVAPPPANGAEQLLRQLKTAQQGNTPGATGRFPVPNPTAFPGAGANNAPSPRRRVVLPTPSPNPTPAPVAPVNPQSN